MTSPYAACIFEQFLQQRPTTRQTLLSVVSIISEGPSTREEAVRVEVSVHRIDLIMF
jgi:hypothetical protein